MRLKIVIMGIFVTILSVPSYSIIPPLISTYMSKFTGGSTVSPIANQIFSQLGIPSIDTMVKFVQYSFIGLIVAGLFITVFGMLSKKMSKQSPVTLHIESNQLHAEENDEQALHSLKERLAKGEITSSQYMNIKKMLEDKV